MCTAFEFTETKGTCLFQTFEVIGSGLAREFVQCYIKNKVTAEKREKLFGNYATVL